MSSKRMLFSYTQFRSTISNNRNFFDDPEVLRVLDMAILAMATNKFKLGAQDILNNTPCGQCLKDLITTKVTLGELPGPSHVYWTIFTEALLTFSIDAIGYVNVYKSSGYDVVSAVNRREYGELEFINDTRTKISYF